jgi:hypothetical protein
MSHPSPLPTPSHRRVALTAALGGVVALAIVHQSRAVGRPPVQPPAGPAGWVPPSTRVAISKEAYDALESFCFGSTLSPAVIDGLLKKAERAEDLDDMAKQVAIEARDLDEQVKAAAALVMAGKQAEAAAAMKKAASTAMHVAEIAGKSAKSPRTPFQGAAPRPGVKVIDYANAGPRQVAELGSEALAKVQAAQRALVTSPRPPQAELAKVVDDAARAAQKVREESKTVAENKQLNKLLETEFERAYQFEVIAALWRVCQESGKPDDRGKYYLSKYTDPVERRRSQEQLFKLTDKVYYKESKDDLTGVRVVCHLKVRDDAELAAILPVGWNDAARAISPIDPPDNLRVLIKLGPRLIGLSLTLGSGGIGPAVLSYQNYTDEWGHQLSVANPNTVSPWGCRDCHVKSFNIKDKDLAAPGQFADRGQYRAAVAAMPGLSGKASLPTYLKERRNAPDALLATVRKQLLEPESFFRAESLKDAVLRRWVEIYPEYKRRFLDAPVVGTSPASDGVRRRPLGVRDDGRYFSAAALTKANDEVCGLLHATGRDLLVETYAAVPAELAEKVQSLEGANRAAFFRDWAKKRSAAAGVNGVTVLICRDPGYLTVAVSESAKAAFDPEASKRLREALKAKVQDGNADDGLLAIVRQVREAFTAAKK